MGQDGRLCFTTALGVTSTLEERAVPFRAAAARGEELWLGDVHGGLHKFGSALRVEAHDAAITSIAIASDGTVVTGSEDGAVKRWRDQTLQRCSLSEDFVTSVALSPKGEVICGGYDGDIFSLGLQF